METCHVPRTFPGSVAQRRVRVTRIQIQLVMTGLWQIKYAALKRLNKASSHTLFAKAIDFLSDFLPSYLAHDNFLCSTDFAWFCKVEIFILVQPSVAYAYFSPPSLHTLQKTLTTSELNSTQSYKIFQASFHSSLALSIAFSSTTLTFLGEDAVAL